MRDNYFNYPLRSTTNELHLQWCGQRSFLHRFSFVKWYLSRSLSSSQRPFRYPLTLRIIHRLGLKSKIHNHSIFPSLFLLLFLCFSPRVLLALHGSLLPFAFPKNVLLCVSFLIFPSFCSASTEHETSLAFVC